MVKENHWGIRMKIGTVNELRRITILFLLCILISYLINSVVDYPLWIDICLAVGITLPINIKALGRLDVEEV